jgi:hypothetical protein
MAVVPAAAAAAAAADGSVRRASPADALDVEFHLEGCPKMRLKRSSSDEIVIVSLPRPSSTPSRSNSASAPSVVLANLSKASFAADPSMRPALSAAGHSRFHSAPFLVLHSITQHVSLPSNFTDVVCDIDVLQQPAPLRLVTGGMGREEEDGAVWK